MTDARAAQAHFGWFKRRRHMKVDEVTVVDGTMLRRMLGSQGADDDLEWAVAQFVRPTAR